MYAIITDKPLLVDELPAGTYQYIGKFRTLEEAQKALWRAWYRRIGR